MKRPEELKQKRAKNTKIDNQPGTVYGGKAMERVKQFNLARGLSIPGEASDDKGSRSTPKVKRPRLVKGKATARGTTKR